MDLGKAFIRNVKKYRREKGISQEKLAALCGASHSYIRQVECGSRSPSFSFIGRLSSALRIPPALLFSDDDKEKPYKKAQKEQIEADLLETISQNVRTAFSKL